MIKISDSIPVPIIMKFLILRYHLLSCWSIQPFHNYCANLSIHKSIARYSFIQLNELRQREWTILSKLRKGDLNNFPLKWRVQHSNLLAAVPYNLSEKTNTNELCKVSNGVARTLYWLGKTMCHTYSIYCQINVLKMSSYLSALRSPISRAWMRASCWGLSGLVAHEAQGNHIFCNILFLHLH